MKTIGMIVLALFLLVAAFFIYNMVKPAVPGDYETAVETGGNIEARYLIHGSHDVRYREQKVMENYKKYNFQFTEVKECIFLKNRWSGA